MSLKQLSKDIVKNKIKKVVFNAIKPFLPYIIIIVLFILVLCVILDTVFVQAMQVDNTSMSKDELELKNRCIEKAKVINICNNFIDDKSTNYLLDVNNLEENKQIEWSHLYVLMTLQSLNNNYNLLDSDLLAEMSNYFISTFTYTTNVITTETKTINDEDEEIWEITSEETEYILIESDTIIGHYTYEYKENVTLSEDGNTKTTKKVYVSETLVGEKYERLKNYLREYVNIRESDLDTMVQLVIDAQNSYYDSTIINSNNIYVGKGMFSWPIPGYTTITSPFGYRTDPITR